jgi:hypothetical protein
MFVLFTRLDEPKEVKDGTGQIKTKLTAKEVIERRVAS